MTNHPPLDPQQFVRALRNSGLTIYDHIEVGDPVLWIPTPELEYLLDNGLQGLDLAGLPLRTRSKFVKTRVCNVLGYPVPALFKKTQPRFPGQLLDAYTQKANNLQVWNEELAATRRYALIRVGDGDIVSRVKVVTGDSLAVLDTTGTLTSKYQARCIPTAMPSELVSTTDTAPLTAFVSPDANLRVGVSPVRHPAAGELLPVGVIFDRLAPLVGQRFADPGFDQERNRGAALHRSVCTALGYGSYQDDGQFPDIRHQLLEVKLQTSPTIDLGLVKPDSVEALDVPMIMGHQVRHCDVRYAVFYAHAAAADIVITHFFLTTGQAFFSRFAQFQGKVLNAKLQIALPFDFFER